MSKEVINLAEKLIKFKTISHHYKEIKECASFIERYAKANHLYQINRVSDMAVAQLDFRLVDGMDAKKVAKILNNCLVGNTRYEIRYETGFVNEDRNNPVIKEYKKIVESIIDKKVEFLRDGRMSNSGMLKDKKGASVILHSYSGGGYHAEDEWVDIKSVEQLYNIQKKFIENYSKER